MKLVAFARARLAERSTRVQLAVLAALALVVGGFVTFDQIHEWSAKIVALAAVAGPLLGILSPDNNSAVDAAARADEAVAVAVDIATDAAEKAAGPGAREASLAVTAAITKLGL